MCAQTEWSVSCGKLFNWRSFCIIFIFHGDLLPSFSSMCYISHWQHSVISSVCLTKQVILLGSPVSLQLCSFAETSKVPWRKSRKTVFCLPDPISMFITARIEWQKSLLASVMFMTQRLCRKRILHILFNRLFHSFSYKWGEHKPSCA